MKTLLILFCGLFLTGYIFTEATAMQSPKTDELELLMQRIQKNLQEASAVTQEAQKMSAKLVEKKVEEKAELKEAVLVAEAKVEKMEQVQEIFVSKMVQAGIDTALVVDEGRDAGPIFEAFKEYQKNGGTEDFGYFRLYIWQQK